MPHQALNSKEDVEKALATKGKYVLIYGYEGTPSSKADEMADKFSSTTDAYSVNLTEHPIVKEKYSINAVPALIVFKDGQEVKRSFGVDETSRQEIIDLLSS